MQFNKIAIVALSLVASANAFVPSSSTLRVAPRLAHVPSPTAMSNNDAMRHKKVVARNMAATVSEEAAPVEEEEGGATVTELIFNLVKGIVGAGMSHKLWLVCFWCKLLTPSMPH